MTSWASVILAAGQSTRMKSRLPKPLHPLCGQPLVQHVLDRLREALPAQPVLVVPPGAVALRQAAGDAVRCVVQAKPRGTGDALRCTMPLLEGRAEQVLALYADTPLLRAETLRALMAHHLAVGADLTFLTAVSAPSEGLGRVVRDHAGQVTAVVEEREATQEQRRIPEVNGGVHCFRAARLWPLLAKLAPAKNGERYLTDLVALTHQAGGRVETVAVEDGCELLGVNTRLDLAQAEGLMRERIRRRWMLAGVTLVDPPSTFIDSAVELGQDTVLLPNTHLYGRTRIGPDCRLGPNTVIVDSLVGEGCKVVASMLEGATLEPGADVGPFSHLRPGAYVERGVHIGNFVEVKESRLGQGAKIGHFSYIGDATVGPNVNIGAGAVTCNFDGEKKHPTVIEEGAFIGSDTMLVAPVTVGRGAVTGAGAVVTRDVPPHTLVVGAPARPFQGRGRARLQSPKKARKG